MAEQYFDVIIAGAGLAACSSAIVLREAGFSVAMFDEVQDEAIKIGEALPGAAKRLLLRLGIASVEHFLPPNACRPCVANVSAWKSPHWTYKDAVMNPEGGGWHLCRNQFDAAMRHLAIQRGVLHIPSRIASVLPNAATEGYHIVLKKKLDGESGSYKSTWVIDATGRASFVSKHFFKVKKSVYSEQMAAVAWMHCSKTDDADQATRIKSTDGDQWLYTARVPNATRVIAAFGAADWISACVKHPVYLIEHFNEQQLLSEPLLATQLLHGPKAADASVSKLEQVAGKNWFAVGDAALSFDPLSSQGMFFALYSGIQAADALIKCSNQPEQQPVFALQYQTLVDSVFEAQQRARAYFYH